MSKNYELVKHYYDNGLWDANRVKGVVGKAYGITAAEYEEITGEAYEA